MYKITLADRALLHMYRYRHISPTIRLGAPKEITQDGVAEVLGISRSHAALLTNKLEESEMLVSGRARVNGVNCRVPRKVYFITSSGVEKCRGMLSVEGETDAEIAAGLIPTNINYCSSSTFWSLPPEERTSIGRFLVLRTPVTRADAGEDVHPLVPFDYKGKLSIKPETRKWYIQRADTDSLRGWHSAAADWCADTGCDPRERLYHLHRSNRRREAARLIKAERYTLMDRPDKDTRDMVVVLAKDDEDLHLISSRMSLRMGEIEAARRHAESAPEGTSRDAILAEILLSEGCTEDAISTALECYVGDVDTAAALGMCMLAGGRHREALVYLDRCLDEMRRTGCLFRMDEVLAMCADAHRESGDEDSALIAEERADDWGGIRRPGST